MITQPLLDVLEKNFLQQIEFGGKNDQHTICSYPQRNPPCSFVGLALSMYLGSFSLHLQLEADLGKLRM